MNEPKFKPGFLYLVTEDLEIAYKLDRKFSETSLEPIRKMIIPKGEVLEFRYYSPAHFRDVFNHYFAIDESQEGRLREVAEIYYNVRMDNQAHLLDILRLGLYKRTDDGHKFLPVRPDNINEHFKGVHYKNL